MKNYKLIILIITALLLITGCEVNNGNPVGMTDLPVDNVLNLYGENAGVYPNTDILDDPDNPFANADINMDNVWDYYDICPSAKAKFYLWATLLANVPTGEHQYFTALALHELYTVGGSINAREQAKKAYRAVLDHFYGSVTWWKADWLAEETYYAVILRDMTGARMYDPTDEGLMPLYSDPAMALADLSEWGYVYDFESGTMSKRD